MPIAREDHPSLDFETLAERAGDPRRDECAEVDAHVENRETRVAPRVLRGIERSDNRAYVWFQETRADDDQSEAGEEEWQAGDGHAEMAACDDDAADEHCAAMTEPSVGDEAAGDAHQVHEHRVQAIDHRGPLRAESNARLLRRSDHVEKEQRAHSVVAEALPHLGHEQRGQAARMAKPLLFEGRYLRHARVLCTPDEWFAAQCAPRAAHDPRHRRAR